MRIILWCKNRPHCGIRDLGVFYLPIVNFFVWSEGIRRVSYLEHDIVIYIACTYTVYQTNLIFIIIFIERIFWDMIFLKRLVVWCCCNIGQNKLNVIRSNECRFYMDFLTFDPLILKTFFSTFRPNFKDIIYYRLPSI